MMRLISDLLPALIAARDGVSAAGRSALVRQDAAMCVVMAANGYPDDPERGSEIRGLDSAASDTAVKIFHAGTNRDGARLIADGGRVLGVSALGGDLAQAAARCYRAIDRIEWPEGVFRRDIGRRSVGG